MADSSACWSPGAPSAPSATPTCRRCAESGFDIVSASPYGLAGPKGMDPGVVRVLHDAFKAALHDPAHLAVLERFDMPVIYMNSDDYRASVQRIIVEEGAVIRRLNLTIN
jgi:tripartite-type tricarboxylate transporter receptor subunit TctC